MVIALSRIFSLNTSRVWSGRQCLAVFMEKRVESPSKMITRIVQKEALCLPVVFTHETPETSRKRHVVVSCVLARSEILMGGEMSAVENEDSVLCKNYGPGSPKITRTSARSQRSSCPYSVLFSLPRTSPSGTAGQQQQLGAKGIAVDH